ncbi:unnamed protein product [Caenorhabditis nigoni]
MTKPSQYAKNGTGRFENFPGCLNNSTEIQLGIIDIGYYFMSWCMGLEIIPDPAGDRIRAYLLNKGLPKYAQISFRVLIKFSRRGESFTSRGKHTTAANKKVFSEHSLKISEIVNNPFDWLKNGALEIEYGVHLEAYHSDDKTWRFIFWKKFFDWNNGFDKITVVSTDFIETEKGYEMYCNKELLNFHSQYFSSIFSANNRIFSKRKLSLSIDSDTHHIEILFQLAHGVRMSVGSDCLIIVPIAEKLKLRNVSRYCERRMIEYKDRSLRRIFLETAIQYDLNHFVAHYLNTRKSVKEMQKSDIQHMSRNTMMLILANVMKDFF